MRYSPIMKNRSFTCKIVGLAWAGALIAAGCGGSGALGRGVSGGIASIRTFSVAAVTGTAMPANSVAYHQAINAGGDVAGYFAESGSRIKTAFLLKGGTFTLIGPFSGAPDSIATGLNDSDLVVGTSGSAVFAWQSGQTTFTDPNVTSGSIFVNQSGQTFRSGVRSDGISHAYLRTNGADQEILLLAGQGPSSSGVASIGLNDGGEALASSRVGSGNVWFTFRNGVSSVLPVQLRPGELLSANSTISGLNNAGTTVVNNGPGTDFLVDANGSTTAMSDGDTFASLNNNNIAVGTRAGRAILWENGQRLDINSMIPVNSGWVLNAATGINDKGQVVGFGTLNGAPTGFILTPS